MSSFAQIQIGQDIDGLIIGGRFGQSCSMSDDGKIIAIGAPNTDTGRGLVKIYELSSVTSSWGQLGNNLTGSKTMNFFGESVALSANGLTLLVGSRTTYSDSGKAQVFELDNGNWIQKGSSLNGENLGDWFGQSVSINHDGNIIAVGAPYNDDAGSNAGHVRVYAFGNGEWVQVGNDIDGESSLDKFGRSVSLSSDGNIIAIGAPGNSATSAISSSGHVRVFENFNGSWIQVGSEINGLANSWSGYSVSISDSGDVLAVGAPNQLIEGAASVYKYDNGSWSKIGSDIYGTEAGDNAGWAVSLSGDGSKIAIGAPNNDGPTYSNNAMGQVLVYELINGNWYSLGQAIYGNNTEDGSGESVTISGDGKVVGIGSVNANGNNLGDVRIFTNASAFKINEQDNNEIIIYPNPARERISVQSSTDSHFTIYNLAGQQLVRGRCNEEIDITYLPTGSYQLRLITEEDITTHSILKL